MTNLFNLVPLDRGSMMNDNMDQSSITTYSFRFGSGDVISLDEQQINLIPYLAALVSSADWFGGVRDEEGYLRLDPNIDSKYFPFILQASSFSSLQELLTQLPVEHDVIAMIAHLDFLGLIIEGNPTLDDVDGTFFFDDVFNSHLLMYFKTIRLCNIKNMAARFTVALAREEYDFSDDQVMDRIYWYVMFILSGSSMFDCRFRHNVYRVAEICFRLFKSSLLKPLQNLRIRIEKEAKSFPAVTDISLCHGYEETCCTLKALIQNYGRHFYIYIRVSKRHKCDSRLSDKYRYHLDEHYSPAKNRTPEEKLLEPLLATVSLMIYEHV